MAIINRPDGSQFIVQAYRESLSVSKKSLLAQDIKRLSEQHGQYALINCNQGADSESSFMNAIFASKSAYLFAECMWEYLHRPENLVYCEALGDGRLILVVVRDAQILVDNIISQENLAVVLLPILAEKKRYKMVACNGAPLTEGELAQYTVRPTGLIDTYETIEAPMLPLIPLQANARLQPIASALRSAQLVSSSITWVSLIAVAVVMLAGGWWLSLKSYLPTAQLNIPAVSQPYKTFDSALSTVAPNAVLDEFVEKISSMYLIPGWTAANIRYDGDRYHVQVNSAGGDTEVLEQWARRHGFEFSMLGSNAQLTAATHLKPRAAPEKTYKLQQVTSTLIDSLDRLLQENVVSVGVTQRRGNALSTVLTVKIDNLSPDLLKLIGLELAGMPVILTSAHVRIDSGLINGTMELSVWGAQ